MQKVDWTSADGQLYQAEHKGRKGHVLTNSLGTAWWIGDGAMTHLGPHMLEEAKAEAEQELLALPIPTAPAGDLVPPDVDCGQCLQTQCPGGECGLPDPSSPRANGTVAREQSPRQTLVRRLASTAPAQVQAELSARADRVDGYYEALRQLAEAETVAPELLKQMQGEAAAFAHDVGDAALEVRRELLLQQALAKAVLDHHQAQVETARKRLKEVDASIERIDEQVLRVAIERAGIGEVPTLQLTTAKVALWKNTPSVVLDDDLDARLLPERFQRVSVEADKRAIGDAIKAGQTVPGCSLVQRDRVEVR